MTLVWEGFVFSRIESDRPGSNGPAKISFVMVILYHSNSRHIPSVSFFIEIKLQCLLYLDILDGDDDGGGDDKDDDVDDKDLVGYLAKGSFTLGRSGITSRQIPFNKIDYKLGYR